MGARLDRVTTCARGLMLTGCDVRFLDTMLHKEQVQLATGHIPLTARQLLLNRSQVNMCLMPGAADESWHLLSFSFPLPLPPTLPLSFPHIPLVFPYHTYTCVTYRNLPLINTHKTSFSFCMQIRLTSGQKRSN